jgi:hypothetical protein
MKATSTTLIAALFCSVFLSSCNTCDDPTIAYPTETESAWLVYPNLAVNQNNYKPKFETEKDSIVTFKYMGLNVQNVPGEGVSIADECLSQLDIQAFAQVADSLNRYPSLNTYILKQPNNLKIRLAIQGRGDWAIDPNSPTYTSKEVNGYNYDNVYEIKPDSIKVNSVKQILFNKEYGYLQVDFQDGKQLRAIR